MESVVFMLLGLFGLFGGTLAVVRGAIADNARMVVAGIVVFITGMVFVYAGISLDPPPPCETITVNGVAYVQVDCVESE